MESSRVVHTGIGAGAVFAAILSYDVNHSTMWMIIHSICSWFYVIYHVLTH